jgi:hypothetical protein
MQHGTTDEDENPTSLRTFDRKPPPPPPTALMPAMQMEDLVQQTREADVQLLPLVPLDETPLPVALPPPLQTLPATPRPRPQLVIVREHGPEDEPPAEKARLADVPMPPAVAPPAAAANEPAGNEAAAVDELAQLAPVAPRRDRMLPLTVLLVAVVALAFSQREQLPGWARRVPAWLHSAGASITLAIVPPAPPSHARRK